MSGKEEYWDIYDLGKNPTGRTMRRNDWKRLGKDYHLCVLGVLKRPDGRFLITRRVMSKSWAPGWWEVPGGAAMAGETSREAVNREVREETGLDVSACAGGYVFTYHREDPDEGNNYFEDVYCFELDFSADDVKIRREEALEFRLAKAEEIRTLADRGIFLHYQSLLRIFEKKPEGV